VKKLIIFFFALSLFAFKVEFNNNYQTFIIPNKKAILITKVFPINYKKKIITKKGIILLDYQNADEFVRNSLYLPKDADVKDVDIAILDIDKIRYKIIKMLQKKYYKCKIKKIEFLDNNYNKAYFKPIILNIRYKVILSCAKNSF
jgi:hypothetical protein